MKLKSVLKHFFKMTGWTQTVLEHYVDLLTGFPFKSEFFSDDINDIPLVKGDNLHQQYIDWETAKKWNQEDLKNLEKYQLQVDDIVLAMDRPWIEAGLKYAWIKKDDPKSLLVQRVSRLRGKNGLETNYLRYIIGSPDFTGYLKNIVTGVTVPHISPKQILSFKFKLPPLPTQQKIASILSAYDELIENNKQLIKLLEEMAEEIYKEWFVRLRFPNYENTEFVDGLPKGWRIVRLKECFEHYIGGGWGEDTPSVKNNEPAYVIRGTDIPNAKVGNLNFEVLRYHSASNLSSRRLQANDIVFEVSGGTETQSLGRSLLISKSLIDRFDEDLICASFCKLIRAKQSLTSGLFIYLLLNRLYKTGEIMLYQVQSTGISNYKFEDFIEKQKVQIPTTEIQDSFNEIIQPMFDEIQMLGAKNQLLQQTRDLLLPRLISGKLSVEGLAEAKEYVLGQNADPWSMVAEAEGDYHHS